MSPRVARGGRKGQQLTRAVIDLYGDRCWLQLPGCTGMATTRDHLIPVAQGGTDDLENMRPACRTCNSTRQDMPIGGVSPQRVHVYLQQDPPQHLPAGAVIVDATRIADALSLDTIAQHHRLTAVKAWRTAATTALRLAAPVELHIVVPSWSPQLLSAWSGKARALRYTVHDGRSRRPQITGESAAPSRQW